MVNYVLSSLTGEEIQSLTQLLEKMRDRAYSFLKQGADMEEIKER